MERERRSRRVRLAALLTGVALAGVACGGGEESTGTAAAPAGDDASVADQQTSASTAENPDPGTATDADDSEEAQTASNFPDIDVVNLADGSTVNLSAELSGGDTPVLLWFWAPH